MSIRTLNSFRNSEKVNHLHVLWPIPNLEYGQRDGPFGDRCPLWFLRNNESASEAFVFDHLVAKELRQAFGGGDGSRFLSAVFLQSPRHGTILRDQTE